MAPIVAPILNLEDGRVEQCVEGIGDRISGQGVAASTKHPDQLGKLQGRNVKGFAGGFSRFDRPSGGFALDRLIGGQEANQGNVLTGAPVLAAAEAAFTGTPGDLPAKTMAAMEAARSMGGDGRCSCSPSAPTSCGSPPPSFAKAADIGFFVISRFGDTDDPACTNAGCADGDYFMDFNIAFQGTADPDPVYQIQALFDAARLDLVGRPDAIASGIGFSRVPGPGDQWLLRVELRDWQGDLLGYSVVGFTVEHGPDSDQVTTIGTVSDLGDGSYEVILTETGPPGVDVFHMHTADRRSPGFDAF